MFFSYFCRLFHMLSYNNESVFGIVTYIHEGTLVPNSRIDMKKMVTKFFALQITP